jgi:hypothetical protein
MAMALLCASIAHAADLVVVPLKKFDSANCHKASFSEFSGLAKSSLATPVCFEARVFSVTDRLRLEPPAGAIGPDDPQGILISTEKVDGRTLGRLNNFDAGDIVLVNGTLRFDRYCWEVGATENVRHVCAPEGHPVTLLSGTIAKKE